MTPELHSRIKRGKPPFDGICLRNTRDFFLEELVQLISIAAEQLGPQGESLNWFPDWHEHDGFIVEAIPTTWKSILQQTASEDSLFRSRHEDLVSTAIYPRSFEWLMRYNIDEEDPNDFRSALCDFDFSASRDAESGKLIEFLQSTFVDSFELVESAAWFTERWGG